MFRRIHDERNQLESTNYFSGLDGYLTALQSMNPSIEQNISQKNRERFLLGIPPIRASIDVRIH